MRVFTSLRVGILLATLMAAGCGDPRPASQSGDSSTHATATKDWPPLAEKPITLAENKLATNYLVLFDNSGSMNDSECSGGESKFDVSKRALKRFADSLPPGDNLALVVFDDRSGRVVVPFGSGASQRKNFIQKVDAVESDQGTPLHGASVFAYQTMVAQAQLQLGYGIYRLVIVTDGESQDYNPESVAREIVQESPIELHVIGFCVGSNHSLNIPGVTRFYTADDPAALAKGLQDVQAEVASFDATTFSNN